QGARRLTAKGAVSPANIQLSYRALRVDPLSAPTYITLPDVRGAHGPFAVSRLAPWATTSAPPGRGGGEYPQRDSNPCRRRERPVSWAARRWGPGQRSARRRAYRCAGSRARP